MSNFLENFHIQISSNDSNDVFPENKISSFKSKLPKSIDLSDNWSIALTEFIFRQVFYGLSHLSTTLK